MYLQPKVNAENAAPSPSDHRRLLRRVFILLASQVATTIVGAVCTLWLEPVRRIVVRPELLLAVDGSMLCLVCIAPTWSRRAHGSATVLWLLTLCLTFHVAHVIGRVADPTVILEALGVTCAVFSTLGAATLATRRDYSFLGAWLWTGTLSLFFFLLMQTVAVSPLLHVVISGVGVVLFSGYILYDMASLLVLFRPEDAVEATLSLYVDAVNLFLTLLGILQGDDAEAIPDV